jgi:hypothetical protein
MISVDDNYKLVNDLASKNNGVYVSPTEYNRYASLASNDLFDLLRGNKNVNRSVYGRNRTLDGRLMPFKKVDAISFTGAYADKPEGCAQILSVYTSDFIPIKPTDEDRASMIVQDPLASPNEQDMYYIEEVDRLRLVGDTGLVGFIEYLALPTPPVYGYTVVSRRPVFDEDTSTNFEWDKNMEMEITTRILSYLGISMKDGFITQVTNNNKAQE